MRILVLDDDPRRHAAFAEHFKGHDVVHITRYVDACRELLGGGWDLVHLDHDLADLCPENVDHDGMYGKREWTGADVAWFLAREVPKDKWPARVVIHSWNPDGARTMQALLVDHIPTTYEPFSPPPGYKDRGDEEFE